MSWVRSRGLNPALHFNRYCQEACRLWNKHFSDGVGKTSTLFSALLDRVDEGKGEVIKTSWGGVAIELHEHPRVEKYLVIRKGGYLALETHEQKDERLEVKEGAGLILSRGAADQPLTVEALAPGDQFHFEPGMEHCIIGTENCSYSSAPLIPKAWTRTSCSSTSRPLPKTKSKCAKRNLFPL